MSVNKRVRVSVRRLADPQIRHLTKLDSVLAEVAKTVPATQPEHSKLIITISQ